MLRFPTERFRLSRKRANPLSLCSRAIPDAKPLRTFAGIALGGLLVITTQFGARAQEKSTIPPDPEIRRILEQRVDVEKQSLGIVVGVIDTNGRRIVPYGHFGTNDARKVDGDTIFEIGSITKVFTALALADMVEKGEVSLDDPVAKYLPTNVTMPQRDGKTITLRELAVHMSGLPRLPDNLAPKNQDDPYADYTVEQLYSFLSGYKLPRDIGSVFEYSNLGFGLLGHALAARTGTDYEGLIAHRITKPLRMDSTGITLSPALEARFTPGHDQSLQSVPAWQLPTLGGAGALRSSTNDMLIFLEAAMAKRETPLKAAFALSEATRRDLGGDDAPQMGLGWMITKVGDDEMIWHNGGTGGYRSFMGFLVKAKVGVVALSNTSNEIGVDDIGRHLLDPTAKLVEAPKVRVAVTVDPALYDLYVGRYQLAPNFILAVTREGDRLMVQATGQPQIEVFPESDREFFYKVVDAQISFETGSDGKAKRLTLHQNGADMPAERIE
jgi:CubicO group peptidase (beta-lactamase class C family)